MQINKSDYSRVTTLRKGKSKMIDKIIAAFFSVVTFFVSIFYTPTPITPVNPETLPEATIEQTVTVMTYNIYMGGTGEKSPENRAPLIKQNVESYNPDSFGMQEVTEDWYEMLKEMFPDYGWVGVGRDRDLGGEASPIFYKKDKFELLDGGTFWLSKTPEKPSRGWDAMFNRVCTYAVLKDKETGFTYAHFNAHFDHLGVIARQESVAVVTNKIAEIAPDMPVVFTGDLNDNRESNMYSAVIGSGFIDSRDLSGSDDVGETYHGYSEITKKELDYIFVNAFVKSVNSYEVNREKLNGIYPSDHHPVVSEITLFN